MKAKLVEFKLAGLMLVEAKVGVVFGITFVFGTDVSVAA